MISETHPLYPIYTMAYSSIYALSMRTLHYFGMCWFTTIHPDRDTIKWCQWCGVREFVRRGRS